MYKQDFECPIPKGVPCTSETDLEAMIVETNQGADLFIPVIKKECTCRSKKKISCSENNVLPLIRKVWICQQATDDDYIQGHYIYQALAPILTEENN